jgi:hypothetical protein
MDDTDMVINPPAPVPFQVDFMVKVRVTLPALSHSEALREARTFSIWIADHVPVWQQEHDNVHILSAETQIENVEEYILQSEEINSPPD